MGKDKTVEDPRTGRQRQIDAEETARRDAEIRLQQAAERAAAAAAREAEQN